MLRLRQTAHADQNTAHPFGCTSFFPFRGLAIGADHTYTSFPIPIP